VLYKTALQFRDLLEDAIANAGEVTGRSRNNCDTAQNMVPDLDLDLDFYEAPSPSAVAVDTATVAALMKVSVAYRRRAHLIALGSVAAATLGAIGGLLTRRR
jgi:hypothetical protein